MPCSTRSGRVTLQEKEREEMEQDRKRRIKEMKLRKDIQDRSDIDYNTSLDKITTKKLREIRLNILIVNEALFGFTLFSMVHYTIMDF